MPNASDFFGVHLDHIFKHGLFRSHLKIPGDPLGRRIREFGESKAQATQPGDDRWEF
jgi:hypothetical protein